jgi:hypothetical protein
MRTDTVLDFYRAGITAALVAEREKAIILVFHDETLGFAEQKAFSEGLKAGERAGEPVFINSTADYYNWSDVACTVVCGTALRFFERNLTSPALLFSWVDPEMTPRPVKVIFDDSPWALAVSAVKAMETGKGGPLPSEFIVPAGRVADKVLAEKLRALALENSENILENPLSIP